MSPKQRERLINMFLGAAISISISSYSVFINKKTSNRIAQETIIYVDSTAIGLMELGIKYQRQLLDIYNNGQSGQTNRLYRENDKLERSNSQEF